LWSSRALLHGFHTLISPPFFISLRRPALLSPNVLLRPGMLSTVGLFCSQARGHSDQLTFSAATPQNFPCTLNVSTKLWFGPFVQPFPAVRTEYRYHHGSHVAIIVLVALRPPARSILASPPDNLFGIVPDLENVRRIRISQLQISRHPHWPSAQDPARTRQNTDGSM